MGASKNGIERVAERGQVVTRGVLLDVARKNGLKHSAPNTIVMPEELDADTGEVLDKLGWSSLVASRAVSPASRFLPASKNSLDHR
jgi:hypothetical protein